MQQSETLICNNCGATIELPRSASYATCARCGAHLVVHRGETAHYTEVLAEADRAEIPKPTYRNRDAELRDIQRQLALLSLDREWETIQARYLVSGTYGRAVAPSRAAAFAYVIFGAILSAFVVILLIELGSVLSQTEVVEVIVIGVLFPIFLCTGLAVRAQSRYKEYIIARNEYLDRRDALLQRRRAS